MNEECLLSCFQSLNGKKMKLSSEKSNFASMQRCAFVGHFSLLYCHKFIYIYIYIYFELYIYNSNLTKEERQAIYSLRDDTSIIIKEADKGSGIVVWDREDYLAEARTQLKDKYLYQELKGNIVGPLEKIIKSVYEK